MRSTTRSCSSCCSGRRRRAAAVGWPAPLTALLVLAAARAAHADDWLAALPPCSSELAASGPAGFSLVYPRPGLPALVSAGDALVARVRVPAPLTPPPGVQQPRALAGWRAELRGQAAPLDASSGKGAQHVYALEVVDVRPDGASTLLYRAAIPIPAWTAPGTYDLALWAPGGSGRSSSVVRVLAQGAAPRVAWAAADDLAHASRAGVPVDVWVVTPRAPAENTPIAPGSPEAIRLAATAPVLAADVPALALRVAGGLWVRGECERGQALFEADVASVLARERRARVAAPEPPASGRFRAWGEAERPWPAADSLRVRPIPGGVEVQVDTAFGTAAELAFLIGGDPRVPVRVAGGVSGRYAFYPASEIAAGALPARVLWLRVAAGERVRAAVAASAAAALAHALRVEPQRARSGAPVRIALAGATERAPARSSGDPRGPGLRVAWRLDALRTAFGPAQVEHRFLPLGSQRVHALVLAEDGRAQRIRANVRVETARASGCRAVGSARDAAGAWLWPAGLLIQRRARRKSRGVPRSGIDCEPAPVLRGLTVTARTSFIALVCWIAASFSGCAHETIPNTHVEDTSENREIIEFVERYRKAVEDRDIVTLLNMTSPFYFDDMGTPTGDDDIDYDALKAGLERMRKDVLAARYQISYRGLTYTPNDRVLVDLLYTGWFKVETTEGPEWRRRLEPHRIVLAREDGKLLIVSGM